MTEAAKLKDYFTGDVVADIGDRIQRVASHIDVGAFTSRVFATGWDELTFTGRSRRIADELWVEIDRDVPAVLDVLVAALPVELDEPDGALSEGFWMWPFGDAIAAYAIDHPLPALDACEALTKCFTAEFAVRPFLDQYPEALDRAEAWAGSSNQHVRRLASEGTRPRLPWATRLDLPTDRVLGILQQLRADPSLYVRRSVANHLNDLAKSDSDAIVTMLEAWHAEGVDETTWIVRHAMRNHLKQGDPRVLGLFGYDPAEVAVDHLAVAPDRISIGGSVEVTFDLVERAGRQQKLMVDLVVGYVKANGTVSPKVFKFKDFDLAAGETESCTKRLDLIVRSTRALHPGRHSVTVRVNGADLATQSFELTASAN